MFVYVYSVCFVILRRSSCPSPCPPGFIHECVNMFQNTDLTWRYMFLRRFLVVMWCSRTSCSSQEAVSCCIILSVSTHAPVCHHSGRPSSSTPISPPPASAWRNKSPPATVTPACLSITAPGRKDGVPQTGTEMDEVDSRGTFRDLQEGNWRIIVTFFRTSVSGKQQDNWEEKQTPKQ